MAEQDSSLVAQVEALLANEESRLDFIADIEGWARVHGLVMGSGAVAPITLTPHVMRAQVFNEGLELAPLFGKLTHNISRDTEFIESALHQVSDEFTTRLLRIMKTVNAQGVRQKAAFGIHRSDYMIHHGEKPQQVELNTISSAFGALSSQTSKLHNYILNNWVTLDSKYKLPPPNNTLETFPAAFKTAVHTYGLERPLAVHPLAVVMIVQPGERNSIDQRWLQYELWEQHRIKFIRKSLAEIEEHAILDESTGSLIIDELELAVAYFRAGYTPNDYPTEKEWAGRLKLERSLAIKCPNIAYHLAGTKKIQQVLYDRVVLDKYLPEKEEADKVFASFTDQYSLDPGSDESIIEEAKKNPHDFVMKPQREGGGNLIANSDMVKALSTMSPEERANYILMRRIEPAPAPTVALRDSKATLYPKAIAEFGVYTLFIGNDKETILNEAGGWLLRTKDESLEDGGVAAGRAVLDSPLLIN